MSIALDRPPHVSAWDELIEDGMVKDAAPAWLQNAWGTVARGVPGAAQRALGGAKNLAVGTNNLLWGGAGAPGLAPRAWSKAAPVVKSPYVRATAAAAPVLGGITALGTHLSTAATNRQTAAMGAKPLPLALTNEARAREQAAPQAGPGLGQQIATGAQGLKDFAGQHWPWLLGGGVALGGLGMYMKSRADREKEEEEEELLRGMGSKQGMAKLAAEFPVQVGFLARCSEHRLSGREIRAAIEKCGSISDGLAEDWIRFFEAASGPMIKTALDPAKVKIPQAQGADAVATAAAAGQPLPPGGNPNQPQGIPEAIKPIAGGKAETLPGAPPGPLPRAQTLPGLPPGAPQAPPVPVAGPPPGAGPGPVPGAVPGSAAVATSGAGAPAAPAGPVRGARPWLTNQQRDAETGASPAGQAQRKQWMDAMIAADRRGDKYTADMLRKSPPQVEQGALTPESARPYRTATQELMAQAPTEPGLAARRQWQGQIDQLSRAGRLDEMRTLMAHPPETQAAGEAGMNRPTLNVAQALQRRNLLEQGEGDVGEAGNAGFWNSMARNKFVPTRQDVEDAQAKQTRMVNAGMTPEMAAQGNWTSGGNDPTAGSYAKGFASGLGSAPASLLSTTGNLAVDTGRGLLGGGFDYTGTQNAARDFFAPVARGFGAAQTAGPQVNQTFFQDTTPGWADQLHDYAGGTGGNALTRWGAGMLETPTRYAGPLTSMAMGLKMPFAPSWMGAAMPTMPAWASAGAGAVGRGLGAAGLTPTTATVGSMALGQGINQGIGQATGGAQQDYQQEQMAKTLMGDPNAYQKARPMPTTPEDVGQWANDFYENQRAGRNAQRAQEGYGPMNPAEEQAFKQETLAPVEAKVEQMHQDRVAQTVPGMTDANGKYNPNGQIDTTGMDPNNITAWMNAKPGRPEALAYMKNQSGEQFEQMAQKLPPEMAERLSRGGQATPQDIEAIKAAGGDPAAIQQTSQRLAMSTALSVAHQNGGNLNQTIQQMQDPKTLQYAAEKNPSLVDAAKEESQATGTDMWSTLSKMWTDMGPMGQILAVGGLAVGAIGLMNAFSGEGGLGSILPMLLGGGAVALGVNKDWRNALMNMVGLGGGEAEAGGPEAAEGPAAGVSQPGDTGAPTVTAPGGAAPAPGAPAPGAPAAGAPAAGAPAAPAQSPAAAANVAKASKMLGIDVSPQGMGTLMQTPSRQLVPKVKAALGRMDMGTRAKLYAASQMWAGGDQAGVMKQIRAMPGFENMQPQQVGKFMEAYNMS